MKIPISAELLIQYLNNQDEYSSRYPMEWCTIIRAILPSIIAFSQKPLSTLQTMLQMSPSLL
jgi:hypothetical protein